MLAAFEKKPICVYVLRDPVTNSTRYVGRTTGPKARLVAHCSPPPTEKCTTPIQKWLRSLVNRGVKPVMETVEVIQSSPQSTQSKAAERKWIETLHQQGHDLLNIQFHPVNSKSLRLIMQENGRLSKGKRKSK